MYDKLFDRHASEVLPTYFCGTSVDTALQIFKSEYDSIVEEEYRDDDIVEEEDVGDEKKAPAEE